MRGEAIVEIFERAGLRLFARNIRGYMGVALSEKRSIG
jgi:hypothetical protein